jgi:BirA family biotin operon repressor/biotin-[acetyl-CoA-carboxylase] ligase
MIAWRLEVHDELPSTSDTCIAAARAGAPAGLAVLARRQSQGRGSRGRSWVSPPGNLYLSYLLRPETPAAEAGIWPLLAGLALHDALAPLLPAPERLQLKWPNDVMLDGAKLAGILLDMDAEPGGGVRWLVVGSGVNLAHAPEVAGRRTACLASAGVRPPAPEEAARAVLAATAARCAEYAHAGAAATHAAWLARAHPVGTALSVRFAGQEVRGEFDGLSGTGHLRLRTAGGVRALAAGEVLLAES